jgi:hypothetical protein
MALPSSVAIGAIIFRVTDEQADHNQSVVDTQVDTYGCINYAKGTIVLDPNQTDQHKRAALLHEVLHGCLHVTAQHLKWEEKAVRLITGPLLDALRRNPALVAYLLEDETNPDVGRPMQVKA